MYHHIAWTAVERGNEVLGISLIISRRQLRNDIQTASARHFQAMVTFRALENAPFLKVHHVATNSALIVMNTICEPKGNIFAINERFTLT